MPSAPEYELYWRQSDMKIHPTLRVQVAIWIGGGAFAVLLGWKIYEYDLANGYTVFVTVLLVGVGIWMVLVAIPFHRSITRMLKEDVPREMLQTIQVHRSSTGDHYYAHLRSPESAPDDEPEIIVDVLCEPWIEGLPSVTKVKAYGVDMKRGPVVIETDRGILWPNGPGGTSRSRRRKSWKGR